MWTTKLSPQLPPFRCRHEHAGAVDGDVPCGSHKMSKMHRVGSDRALHSMRSLSISTSGTFRRAGLHLGGTSRSGRNMKVRRGHVGSEPRSDLEPWRS